jgi:hypothetical protein
MNRAERRAALARQVGGQVVSHPLIAHTAKEMAATLWEECAKRDSEFRARFPSQTRYVERSWGLHVEAARSTLAGLLATNIAEPLKEQIHEAILADNSVRHGRGVQIVS